MPSRFKELGMSVTVNWIPQEILLEYPNVVVAIFGSPKLIAQFTNPDVGFSHTQKLTCASSRIRRISWMLGMMPNYKMPINEEFHSFSEPTRSDQVALNLGDAKKCLCE
uniref:Uncharacterized protein n=1 Tax=Romanomermis culicivorax TaxID=13658 RepID=A0A915L814_ROMCU